jgi:hypothetical protein
MEPITEKSRTPSLILPPYALVVFVVVTAFAAVNAGVGALAGYMSTPFDPFAAFADVFPGQSRSAVAARGFSCPSANAHDTYQDLSEETCTLSPESGPFSRVELVLSGDTISQIGFMMRDDMLKIGDLMRLWGKAEVQEYSRSVYLFWRSRGIVALAPWHTGQFSVFLPVRWVYFLDD